MKIYFNHHILWCELFGMGVKVENDFFLDFHFLICS